MDKKKNYCYELWGYDTFSSEEYLCYAYSHYSSAWRAMQRHIKECRESQDEGLSDKFWIKRVTIEEHNAAVEARWARIDVAQENNRRDMEALETILPELDVFLKECTKSVGKYYYPLPESFKETCIRKIVIIFEKSHGYRVQYHFTVKISLGKYEDATSDISATFAWGRYNEVVARINSSGHIDNLREYFSKYIHRYYFEEI